MSTFEDHMKIVEGSQEKTASVKNESLLTKLAAELSSPAAAPKSEGEITPADASVVAAAPAVVAATDAVAVPQEVIAGADPAEKPAGEIPAATKPNEGVVVSAGDGEATDSNQLHKVPAAVATAATSAEGEKTASVTEAEEAGRKMAHSFNDELQKIAQDRDYVESVEILKEAKLFDGYNFTETGIVKEAEAQESGLEKLSAKQPVSKIDIINAAAEYVDLEKQAEDADAYGRQLAHQYVAELQKEAEEKKETPAAPAAEVKKEEAPAAAAAPVAAPAEEKKEEEKTASLNSAVEYLVSKGVISA